MTGTRTHNHLVHKATLNHAGKVILASLAKCLSVRLRTKSLWVRVQLQSLKWLQRDSNPQPFNPQTNTQPFSQTDQMIGPCRESLSVRCIWLYVLIMSRTRFRVNPNSDKYSQHSSIIWPVWLNGWVFVYELNGCGFESRYSHLNFRYRACFEQGVPWHSGNYRVWIHSETRTWYDKNIQTVT